MIIYVDSFKTTRLVLTPRAGLIFFPYLPGTVQILFQDLVLPQSPIYQTGGTVVARRIAHKVQLHLDQYLWMNMYINIHTHVLHPNRQVYTSFGTGIKLVPGFGHTSLVWYLIDTSVHTSIDTKSLVPSTGIYIPKKTEVPALFCFCCSNHGTHQEEHLQQCVQYMNGPCSGEKNLRWGVHQSKIYTDLRALEEPWKSLMNLESNRMY